jgi:hypothetical protein
MAQKNKIYIYFYNVFRSSHVAPATKFTNVKSGSYDSARRKAAKSA